MWASRRGDRSNLLDLRLADAARLWRMSLGAESFAQEVAQVAIRPRRLGYLIQAGNESHMRRAVSYATTEWGGISHPILPVRKGGVIDGLWQQVSSILEVEIVIDYGNLTPEVRDKIAQDLSVTVLDPKHFGRGIEPGIHTMVAIAPNSLDRMGLLTASPTDGLLATVALGTIPDDQQEIWAQSGGIFQPGHSMGGLLAAQLAERGSSLGLTVEQVPTFQAEGIFSGVFAIFAYRRVSVSKGVFFWNMRALGNRFGWEPDRLVIVPPQALQDKEVIERLKIFLERKQRTSPNFILLGDTPEDARALGIAAGFVEAKDRKLTWHFAGQKGAESLDPMSFLPNAHPAQFVMGKRREGRTRDVPLGVSRPKSPLYVRSPVKFNTSINGYLRMDVRGVKAWSWPRSDEVAKLIHRDATAVDEGFSLVTSPNSVYRFEFDVPDPHDVCSAFLRERSWDWTYSDKGKYAAALIEAHGLPRLEVLAQQKTLDVVGALASTSRLKAEQLLERAVRKSVTSEDLEQVVSQILPYGVRRWLTAGDLAGELKRKKVDVLQTLSQLLDLGLVHRGLEFDCDRCGLSTYLPIEEVEDRVRCPGCRAESALLGPKRGEPIWAYSLNSLLDRAWDQDCLDHVLLLRWLWENDRIVWGAPGADVRKEGRHNEVDLLGVSHSELQIGEMKPPHAFTDEVVKKRIQLASDLGARRLILASLVPWSQEQLNMAREWGTENLIVEVIDGSQVLK